MDKTYSYREGLGLPNNHNSRRILVHIALMEKISLNVLIEGYIWITLIMVIACFMYIHSSHENIMIVTLTIWHDFQHFIINSLSQKELTISSKKKKRN